MWIPKKNTSWEPRRARVNLHPNFSSLESFRFRELIHKPVIMERGIKFDSINLHESLEGHVKFLGWQHFCRPPIYQAIPALVCEFYAKLADSRDDFVTVRGVRVPVSPLIINKLLETRIDGVDEGIEYEDDDPRLTIISHTLTDGMESWKPEGKEVLRTIGQGSLNCLARMWHLFVASRLLPINPGLDLSQSRAITIFHIAEGYHIDVGKIIFRNMKAVALGSTDEIWYPNLVTELCLKAGVRKMGELSLPLERPIIQGDIEWSNIAFNLPKDDCFHQASSSRSTFAHPRQRAPSPFFSPQVVGEAPFEEHVKRQIKHIEKCINELEEQLQRIPLSSTTYQLKGKTRASVSRGSTPQRSPQTGISEELWNRLLPKATPRATTSQEYPRVDDQGVPIPSVLSPEMQANFRSFKAWEEAILKKDQPKDQGEG